MKTNLNSDFYIIGGICGILGTINYILAIMISLPSVVSFLLAISWPIFSLIFAYSVYKYIAIHKQSIKNQLALIFTYTAFILVSIMISIQLVVKSGLEESIINTSGSEKETLSLILSSLRWVDLGVDLAWDMFLGIALILLSLAIWSHPKFGKWWSIPLALLGIAVIVTNLYTFPYPPDMKGLFDVGPLTGSFIIIFGGRLVYLGVKMKETHPNKRYN